MGNGDRRRVRERLGCRTLGSRMGVLDPPATVRELDARFVAFRGELLVDDRVHRTHAFVTHAPLPRALRPGYRVLCRPAWASLPT